MMADFISGDTGCSELQAIISLACTGLGSGLNSERAAHCSLVRGPAVVSAVPFPFCHEPAFCCGDPWKLSCLCSEWRVCSGALKPGVFCEIALCLSTTLRACATSACTCGCCRASGGIFETLSISRCDCSTLSGGVLGGGREVGDGDEGWPGLAPSPAPRGAVGVFCAG